jgi:hypothetical protein
MVKERSASPRLLSLTERNPFGERSREADDVTTTLCPLVLFLQCPDDARWSQLLALRSRTGATRRRDAAAHGERGAGRRDAPRSIA